MKDFKVKFSSNGCVWPPLVPTNKLMWWSIRSVFILHNCYPTPDTVLCMNNAMLAQHITTIQDCCRYSDMLKIPTYYSWVSWFMQLLCMLMHCIARGQQPINNAPYYSYYQVWWAHASHTESESMTLKINHTKLLATVELAGRQQMTYCFIR